MDLTPGTAGTEPERFVPATMHGELAEAEHVARYRLAATLVAGRCVLDAGCGMAYGSALLAHAGASSVVGVDVAESVLDAVRDDMPDGVELQPGDVTRLEFEDASFDVVVCFEVIEHVGEQAEALSEFRRVLTPGGLLVISSPNRDAYVPGNPFHVHEYTPEELRADLGGRYENVRLLRQQGFIGSAVFEDEDLSFEDEREIGGAAVSRAVAGVPGEETYTVALASDVPLPDTRPHLVLTGLVEVRHWQELFQQQQEVLTRQNEYIGNLSRLQGELAELRARLRESEQLLAVLPELERDAHTGVELRERVEATDALVRERDAQLAEAYAAIQRADGVQRGMQQSLSWRVTKPLRALKRLSG